MATIGIGSALGVDFAADAIHAALDYYVRGPAFKQNIQERPLLRILRENARTFPSGKDVVSIPVQGEWMNGTTGFGAGYEASDAVTFSTAEFIRRVSYPWYELHYGLVIDWTTLKADGISIVDGNRQREHSKAAVTRLTAILENRLETFVESVAIAQQDMLWRDGTQDAKALPGVTSIITDDPTTTVGGLSGSTYTWWRNRAKVGANAIDYSPTDQTLTTALRSELIQLKRYGGRPRHGLCGSSFLDALRLEVQAKGYYTQSGFAKRTDVAVGAIELDNVVFEYDPTLDQLGRQKYCYIFDPDKIRLMPMEGEDNKVCYPERPYNYFIFLQSMTFTGALVCTQRNAHGVYAIK